MNQNLKRLLFLFIGLFSITTLPMKAEEAVQSQSTTVEQTEATPLAENNHSKQIDTELHPVNLPDQSKWDQLTIEEKAHQVVSAIYLNAKTEQAITQKQIQLLLGEPEEENQINEHVIQKVYTLEENNQKVSLKLAYHQESKTYLEGLGEQKLPLPGTKVQFQQFDDLSKRMRENYHQKRDSDIELLEEYLGKPHAIGYLFDAIVYHYPGEKNDKYAATIKDHHIADLNYLTAEENYQDIPIKQTKKEFDRLSHEGGLSHQQIISTMGQPHSINYDSKSGIITNAWFSKAANSVVKEVYYYYAYNGISIGLAYE